MCELLWFGIAGTDALKNLSQWLFTSLTYLTYILWLIWLIFNLYFWLIWLIFYDDEWYFGVANHISVENYDVNIKFFQPNGPGAHFFRPSLQGTCWIPIHDIITKVDPQSYGSTGWFYCFDYDEMNCVKKLMWFIPAESFKKLTKMKVQINRPYWILIFRIKINNIDTKNILYFSYLAQPDFSKRWNMAA